MDLHANRLEHKLYELVFRILVSASALGIPILWLANHFVWMWISAAICVFFVYSGFIEPQMISVKRFRMPLVKQPKTWLKIVFLSDLHAGSWKGKLFYDRLVKKVNQLEADLLLIGGDLVEERSEAIKDLSSLAHLSAKKGKYFILGNHDYLDNPRLVDEQLQDWGFENVTNTKRLIEYEGQTMELVGLDDPWFGAPDVSLIHSPINYPRFVFTHEPDMLMDMEDGEADIVVMGHTHGGQVRLPFIGSVTRLPQQMSKELDRGLHVWHNIPVIISQGLGESNARMRFLCPPQIVVIEVGI